MFMAFSFYLWLSILLDLLLFVLPDTLLSMQGHSTCVAFFFHSSSFFHDMVH